MEHWFRKCLTLLFFFALLLMSIVFYVFSVYHQQDLKKQGGKGTCDLDVWGTYQEYGGDGPNLKSLQQETVQCLISTQNATGSCGQILVDDTTTSSSSTNSGTSDHEFLHCFCDKVSFIDLGHWLCGSYWQKFYQTQLLILLVIGSVVCVNVIISFVTRRLVGWERYLSKQDQDQAIVQRVFWLSFLNTALLPLVLTTRLGGEWVVPVAHAVGLTSLSKDDLCQTADTTFDLTPVKSNSTNSTDLTISFVNGSSRCIGDFSSSWYRTAGATLVLTLIATVFSPHAYYIWDYCIKLHRRQSRAKRALSQAELDQLHLGSNFDISGRYGQVMNLLFSCLLFTPGMPVLFPIGALGFALMFWVDKFFFLRFNRRPPHYGVTLGRAATSLLPYAILLQLLVGYWMYGNGSVFPLTTQAEDAWAHQILEPFPFLYDKFLGFDSYSVAAEVVPLFGLIVVVASFLVLRALGRVFWGATGNLLLTRFRCCLFCCQYGGGHGRSDSGNTHLRDYLPTFDPRASGSNRQLKQKQQQTVEMEQKSSAEIVVDSGYWRGVLTEQRRKSSVQGHKPPTLSSALEWDRLNPEAKVLHSLRSYNILHNPLYSEAFGVSADQLADMDYLNELRVSDLEEEDDCADDGSADGDTERDVPRSSVAQVNGKIARERKSRLEEIEASSWYHVMFEEEMALSPERQKQLQQAQHNQQTRMHRSSAPTNPALSITKKSGESYQRRAGSLTWTDGDTTTAVTTPVAPAVVSSVPGFDRMVLEQQLAQFYLQRGDRERAGTAAALLERYGYQVTDISAALLEKYGAVPAGWMRSS